MSNAISIFNVEKLKVNVYSDRRSTGKQAASVVRDRIGGLLSHEENVRIIFAAGPSQNEFLEEMTLVEGIDWSRVVAFHLDEYVGVRKDSKDSWGNFLKERIFAKLNFKEIHYLNPEPTDLTKECERYAALIKEAPIDIVCLGIGENCHIAFNDPGVANFSDPRVVKVVDLDQTCRQQQVNDGCFTSVADVPKQAMTMTIPPLLSAHFLSVVVPGPTKSTAVFRTLKGEISTNCPASILRRHEDAVLFLDVDSASKVL